jgi:hypothetical protein
VSVGGQTAGPSGAGPTGGLGGLPGLGGYPGAPNMGGGAPTTGAGGSASGMAQELSTGDPLGIDQRSPGGGRPSMGSGGPGGSPPGLSGYPGMGGYPGTGAPAGGFGGSTASTRTVYTRWVYRRPTSNYSFIVDKFNHVVQIECIGMTDGAVRTARGIHFGSKFKEIVDAYGAPDAYEISGNSLVIRYLVRHKVAFRLNRLGEDKPHVVTGIVVAAGKA